MSHAMTATLHHELTALAADIVANKGRESATRYVEHCMIPAARQQIQEDGRDSSVATPAGSYYMSTVTGQARRIARDLDAYGYVTL